MPSLALIQDPCFAVYSSQLQCPRVGQLSAFGRCSCPCLEVLLLSVIPKRFDVEPVGGVKL